MPLYRDLHKDSSTPLSVEPTRRIARTESVSKRRANPLQRAIGQTKPTVDQKNKPVGQAKPAHPNRTPDTASQRGPIVGWVAIIDGPGRGQILALHYGINDIGCSEKSRVRLDFGDDTITTDNQAAIIYTASSRRFYLQSITAEILLKGQPAQGSVELTGGEILCLGQTRLRFVPLCGADFDWQFET